MTKFVTSTPLTINKKKIIKHKHRQEPPHHPLGNWHDATKR